MIVSVGTDIVEISRIEGVLARHGERFVARILSPKELRTSSDVPVAPYLSRQFAAKEAVAKCLQTGMREGVHFKTILVLRTPAGAPYVELIGAAKQRADALGISTFHISLSDERQYAVAFAVAVNDR